MQELRQRLVATESLLDAVFEALRPVQYNRIQAEEFAFALFGKLHDLKSDSDGMDYHTLCDAWLRWEAALDRMDAIAPGEDLDWLTMLANCLEGAREAASQREVAR